MALGTALKVARMWDAHVTALHVRVDSRDVAPLAGEGGRLDADGEHISAAARPATGQDPRADRARCRKLTDAQIATAPVVEIRRVTRHTAVIINACFNGRVQKPACVRSRTTGTDRPASAPEA